MESNQRPAGFFNPKAKQPGQKKPGNPEPNTGTTPVDQPQTTEEPKPETTEEPKPVVIPPAPQVNPWGQRPNITPDPPKEEIKKQEPKPEVAAEQPKQESEVKLTEPVVEAVKEEKVEAEIKPSEIPKTEVETKVDKVESEVKQEQSQETKPVEETETKTEEPKEGTVQTESTDNKPEAGAQPGAQQKKKKKKKKKKKAPVVAAEGAEGAAVCCEGGQPKQQPKQQPKPKAPKQQQPSIGVGSWDEGDTESGWITEDNIEEYTACFTEVVSEGPVAPIKVACLTTDFSMQNVLLQMNMNLVSVDGIAIRRSQRWIRRCYACHQLVKEHDIIYCKQCGSTSLQKISYTVDKDGTVTYNIPKYKRSLRGTIYPIPQPKPGQRNNQFIVSAQQLPKQRKRKENLDVDDPDAVFLDENRPRKPPVVGYGKKNPNQARRNIGKKNKSKGRET